MVRRRRRGVRWDSWDVTHFLYFSSRLHSASWYGELVVSTPQAVFYDAVGEVKSCPSSEWDNGKDLDPSDDSPQILRSFTSAKGAADKTLRCTE